MQAFNLLFPDPIVNQLKTLDDESFRDNMIIPNNSHTQTVVFVEKEAVTLELRDLSSKILNSKIKDPSDKEQSKLVTSSEDTVKNSERPGFLLKGKSDPLLVKVALGSVVIVGDQMEYLQRVQVQSNATPAPTSAPIAAKPPSLNFSSQNGVTNGAAQLITLTNGGSTSLTNITPKITGVAAGDFAIQSSALSSCSSTLAAGNTCTLSVDYKPSTAPGTVNPRTATLDVSFSPGSTPLAIALTGSASDTVYFNTTTLDLGTATFAKAGPPAVVAKDSTASLTVTNFESSPMTNLISTSADFVPGPCAGGTLASGASVVSHADRLLLRAV